MEWFELTPESSPVTIGALSLEQKLRRLIYMNAVKPEFHVGDPDLYQVHISLLRLTILQEALDDDLKQLFQLLGKAMARGGIPRRTIIFQLLALLMTNPKATADQKNRIMAKVLDLSDNDQDFFGFIFCYTRSKKGCKLPTSVAKGVRKFYGAKSPQELARNVASFEHKFGWSHKDLIKLAHVKPNCPLMSAVFDYILTRKLNKDATEAQLEVLNIIKQANQLRRCVDPAEAAMLLKTSEFSLEHLMPSLSASEKVWRAVLPKLSTQQILGLLLKLHKLDFLMPASPISCLIIQVLTDSDRVKKSGVHPIEVFTQMRRLEKGGKPVDPKLLTYLKTAKKLSEENLRKMQETHPIDCPHIVSALWRCFDLACANVTPSHKRYLVVIDVPPVGVHRLCIGSKTITYLEAAVAFAAVLLRVEPHVTLAVHQQTDSLQLVRVKKPCPVEQLLQQVADTPSAAASLPTCLTWATTQRERVDVFVNFVQKSPRRAGLFLPSLNESMLNYQTAMNLPNTKLIVFMPVESPLECGDKTPTKVLTIMGFDHTACKVAQCFARDDFF